MPQARADEAIARRDVQIERGRGDLAPAVMEQSCTGPGLVRRLVAGEAHVALDAEQRAAHLARVGTVMPADLRQRGLQVGDQAKVRFAHVVFVFGLVGLEPGAVVVARERAEKTEGRGGKIGVGHQTISISNSLLNSFAQACSRSSKICLSPGGVCARSAAISASYCPNVSVVSGISFVSVSRQCTSQRACSSCESVPGQLRAR